MFERMRSSPLWSSRRLVAVFALAFLVSLFDMLFVHLVGIETRSELAMETLVHGLGLYFGFTIVAVFGTEM